MDIGLDATARTGGRMRGWRGGWIGVGRCGWWEFGGDGDDGVVDGAQNETGNVILPQTLMRPCGPWWWYMGWVEIQWAWKRAELGERRPVR
jgi:hypothetical protein